MRLCIILIFLLLLSCHQKGVSQTETQSQGNYVEGELLVKFKPGTAKTEIDKIYAEMKVEVIRYIESIQVYHIKTPWKTQEAMEKFKKYPALLYAEPNYTVQALPKKKK